MAGSPLLLSFYGDDFTGSTDALESLALAGVRTVLFTQPPTVEQLARYPDLRAIGVAGMTRSMPPAAMEATLRPVLTALRNIGGPIVHYKVCSTFDSSPQIGNIGRVIELGGEIFGHSSIPILAAAPVLGRFCVFGNHFARCGGDPQPYRLDRHPSMSRHPVTPMHEADLRLHLRKQTDRLIELFDVTNLSLAPEEAERRFDAVLRDQPAAVLIDLLYESQLPLVGRLLERRAGPDSPRFVIGSSGVESALCGYWRENGVVAAPAGFPKVQSGGPIIAMCGSCSPVTAGQIEWAMKHGFHEVSLDIGSISVSEVVANAAGAIGNNENVVIHTGGREHGRTCTPDMLVSLGATLGTILRKILAQSRCRRVLIAGGDTSGSVAQELQIQSLEMIGKLARGSPLCRVTAPGSPADGIEMTFKGGQIGNVDFFGLVQSGNSHG